MPDESPFVSIPSGVDIAHYFIEEHCQNFDGQGCEGIKLWREGREYSYLWMEAHIDHDLEQYFLLEVRTATGEFPNETRDYLYVKVGIGCEVECEWHNQPIQFAASHDDHVNRLDAGLKWFIGHVVEDTESKGGIE